MDTSNLNAMKFSLWRLPPSNFQRCKYSHLHQMILPPKLARVCVCLCVSPLAPSPGCLYLFPCMCAAGKCWSSSGRHFGQGHEFCAGKHTHTPSVPPPLQLLSQGMKICFTVILPERTTSFDSDFNGVHHFNAHWYSALLGSRLNSGLSCIFSTTLKKVSSSERRNSIQNHRSTPRPVRCHCLFAFVLQTTINIGCQTRNGTLARAVQI